MTKLHFLTHYIDNVAGKHLSNTNMTMEFLNEITLKKPYSLFRSLGMPIILSKIILSNNNHFNYTNLIKIISTLFTYITAYPKDSALLSQAVYFFFEDQIVSDIFLNESFDIQLIIKLNEHIQNPLNCIYFSNLLENNSNLTDIERGNLIISLDKIDVISNIHS